METRVEIADFEDWRTAAAVAVEELKAGGVVGLPTETVYGLAADAFNADAVAKVFEIKERAARKAQNPRTLEKVDVPAKKVV